MEANKKKEWTLSTASFTSEIGESEEHESTASIICGKTICENALGDLTVSFNEKSTLNYIIYKGLIWEFSFNKDMTYGNKYLNFYNHNFYNYFYSNFNYYNAYKTIK